MSDEVETVQEVAVPQEVEQASTVESVATEVAPVPLHEFCVRLSMRDNRVEHIGTFEFLEKYHGRLSDLEVNYNERYTAFLNQ